MLATVANGGTTYTPWAQSVRRKLAVILGQSNAVGTGRVSNLTASQLHYSYDYPLPYRDRHGNDANPPLFVDYPWSTLGPRIGTTGLNQFGVELSMGRALEAAEPTQWAIMKLAHSSTGLANEYLGGWPSADPDGLTYIERAIAMTQDALDTRPYDLAAFVLIQGEADAANEASALAYDENLLTFIELFRAEFADAPLVYGRLHANASLATMPYRDTLRASQLAADANAGFYMVDQDPYTLGGDSVHYNETGLIALGEAYASVLLSL